NKNGYKYTFTKWKVKISGVKKAKYLRKDAKDFKVTANTKIRAVFKKTKISTSSTPSSKTSTKPSSSSSRATTPTAAPTKPDEEEEE
ncbi:MAG: hypothetical protein IJ725_04565, partial [Ruminococcus sp.]|nr:hypothetical protein [Ruminococcus sp.]